GPVLPAYAISLNGAGAHVGLSAHESVVVIRRRFNPSAPTTESCGVPARSDVNAICVPLGDHVGVVSIAGLFVMRRTFEPSRFITYSSGLPSRFDVKQIRVPSGEKIGSQFCATPLVGVS